MKYKWSIKNFLGHLNVVNKHRFKVFCLCVKVGIPFRGLVHDLSKYSPTEFFEGVKYFSGQRSPIRNCKLETGYSLAWLHHKGRNKHHFEYWIDLATEDKTPIIPYKYATEMICDTLAASLVYNGKDWKRDTPLNYYNRRKDKDYINPRIQKFLLTVYEQVANEGIERVINGKNLKKIYKDFVE